MYRRPDGLYEKIITVDGKRIAFRAKTEKAVSHKILEYHGRIEQGRTFQELAEIWSKEHFDMISYNTLKSYKPAYERALKHFGNTPVKQISRASITGFIEEFAHKKYAYKTVRNQLLVLSLIFKKAVLDGDLQTNPAEYIPIPKNLSRKKRELPQPHYIELIQNNIEKDFGLLAYFLLYTGCRRGEALALQYQDIDFNRHYKLSKNRKRGNGNDSNRKGHDERGGQILDAAERDGRGTGGTGLRGNRHQLRVRRSG